jgi:hypothetical protein
MNNEFEEITVPITFIKVGKLPTPKAINMKSKDVDEQSYADVGGTNMFNVSSALKFMLENGRYGVFGTYDRGEMIPHTLINADKIKEDIIMEKRSGEEVLSNRLEDWMNKVVNDFSDDTINIDPDEWGQIDEAGNSLKDVVEEIVKTILNKRKDFADALLSIFKVKYTDNDTVESYSEKIYRERILQIPALDDFIIDKLSNAIGTFEKVYHKPDQVTDERGKINPDSSYLVKYMSDNNISEKGMVGRVIMYLWDECRESSINFREATQVLFGDNVAFNAFNVSIYGYIDVIINHFNKKYAELIEHKRMVAKQKAIDYNKIVNEDIIEGEETVVQVINEEKTSCACGGKCNSHKEKNLHRDMPATRLVETMCDFYDKLLEGLYEDNMEKVSDYLDAILSIQHTVDNNVMSLVKKHNEVNKKDE